MHARLVESRDRRPPAKKFQANKPPIRFNLFFLSFTCITVAIPVSHRQLASIHGAEMSSSRRVQGLSSAAEHASSLLLLVRRNGHTYTSRTYGPVRSVVMRCQGQYTETRRAFRTTSNRHSNSHHSHTHKWTISPPREPSIHPSSPSSPSSSSLTTSETLSHQVRSLMRLLTHSVVVCTSTHPPSATHPTPIPRAMTMSSFTSLALRPTPVVSFNIATPSRTYDAVAASRFFNIHILASDISGAKIADWLTRGNADSPKLWEGLVDECRCDVAMNYNHNSEGHHPPIVHGPGVLYVLRCRLLDEPSRGLVRVRDHVIVLGEVLEIVESKSSGTSKAEEEEEVRDRRFGLMYTDRTYRQLGNCMVSSSTKTVAVRTNVEETRQGTIVLDGGDRRTTSTIGVDRRQRGPTT
ncbi:flavin reductase like domain-containing protein [Cercophora scortea]|uniref:Flavin reductase like domain-containing protein n=1 Tax=Cercophora scortea TaxID=314031 RepID=A0AAE0IP13_9PEZI|nr:flavin reductase like domain-containing protein [Cercophora scortea]